MSSAEAAVQAFTEAWHHSSNDERIALLTNHATGKLAAELRPETQAGLPTNPAFAPLFTHGFTTESVRVIGSTARARLVVTHAETVVYVLSLKAVAGDWLFTGLQLERTDF